MCFADCSTQRSREIKIAPLVIQFAAFAVTAGYLVLSAAMLHRRNQLSWESLLSRLHPAWLAPHSAPASALMSAPSMCLSAFRDAGVLMQMAGFADRHSSGIDPSIIASLYAEAVQMRFAGLRSLVRPPRIH